MNLSQISQIALPILHAFLVILALLAPLVLLVVVIVDLVLALRGRRQASVGDDFAWWSTHYVYLAWPLAFFWGFLLAHLFTQR